MFELRGKFIQGEWTDVNKHNNSSCHIDLKNGFEPK